MNLLTLFKKTKFILIICSLYLTSCNNTFSKFSRFNHVEKNNMVQFINNQIELNFTTNRIYNFYNKNEEKPSKNFYSNAIKFIKNKRDIVNPNLDFRLALSNYRKTL